MEHSSVDLAFQFGELVENCFEGRRFASLRKEAGANAARNTASANISSSQNSRHDAATDSFDDESRTEECVSPKEEQNDSPSESAFVPIRLESAVVEGGGAGLGSGVEILIASRRDSRRVLRVEHGIDRATLAAVLSVLEAGAC
jgi:uncharacterized protein (DUF4415 family)